MSNDTLTVVEIENQADRVLFSCPGTICEDCASWLEEQLEVELGYSVRLDRRIGSLQLTVFGRQSVHRMAEIGDVIFSTLSRCDH